jgi:AcrR family transcriptional regulator
LATRGRIIEAAGDVIRERGIDGTTLDDVCRRSHTGKGQLFYHFPGGREQLLLSVAEREAARVFDDQEPYLSELTSRAAWMAWRNLVVAQYRDEGLHCPLSVLITDIGRYSPAARVVSADLVRRWQGCVRNGILATQASGEADAAIDADRTASAIVAAILGGVTVLMSTGSAEHLESGLDLCLERLLVPAHAGRRRT